MWYVVVEMAQNMSNNLETVPSAVSRGKFHWLFLDEQAVARTRYDAIVAETDHFAVVPSLGSLVPGWLIVVPKFPLGRIADLDKDHRREFESLVARCIETVETEFGQTFIFEHGGNEGSKVSCGVDQAHLHIVPLDFDLITAALQSTCERSVTKDGFIFPYDICNRNEYWFVSDQKRTISIEASKPESQWFRKLIAQRTGQCGRWDYNEHPFHNHIDKTLKVMGVDG